MLAIRSIASERGAIVRPVHVSTASPEGCRVRQASQATDLQQQSLQDSGCPQAQAPLCRLATAGLAGSRETPAVAEQHHPPKSNASRSDLSRNLTVVALPAECNLTGLQCSNATLNALCSGDSVLTESDGSVQVPTPPLRGHPAGPTGCCT